MHINDLLKDYILIVPKYASYNFSIFFSFDHGVKYDPDIFMKVLCNSFTNNFLFVIFISLSLSLSLSLVFVLSEGFMYNMCVCVCVYIWYIQCISVFQQFFAIMVHKWFVVKKIKF